MIDLSLFDLLLVYGLILLSIALLRFAGAGQERALLVASLRMVLQLLLVGYTLHLVFAIESPLPVLAVLLVMGGLAVHTVVSRIRRNMPHLYRTVSTALLVGCGGSTLYFCNLVIGFEPWYDPRYLIPLSGMIIGNSMTGASLAAERLAEEIQARRDEVETALCLGASARQACSEAMKNAFNAALIPTVNAMAAMGIVFLPGMMTGQILSGTEPMIAVKYQIGIMCVITGSVAATSFLILWQGYRSFFTPHDQLKDLEEL